MDMRDKSTKQRRASNAAELGEFVTSRSVTTTGRTPGFHDQLVAVDDAGRLARGELEPTQMRLWAQLQNTEISMGNRIYNPEYQDWDAFNRNVRAASAGRLIWTAQFYGAVGRVGRGDSFVLVSLPPGSVCEIMAPFQHVRLMAHGASFVRPGTLSLRNKTRARGHCMGLIFGSLKNSANLTIYKAFLDQCSWSRNIWETMTALYDSAMAL